jgi:hypothetical protein
MLTEAGFKFIGSHGIATSGGVYQTIEYQNQTMAKARIERCFTGVVVTIEDCG